MKPQRFFLLALLIFFSLHSFAQKTKISGTVIDKKTNEALPYVSIVFKGTSIGTTTDSLGVYNLESKQATDSILIVATGYKKQTLPVKHNETQRINIVLESENYDLKEVSIKPGRNPAWRILDSVIVHKSENRNGVPANYQRETYDKFQIYFGNYTKYFSHRKQFKNCQYIFDYADTSADGKPLLPIFMAESITKDFVCENPPLHSTVLIANKSSVEKYDQLTAIAYQMVENVNIYDNFFQVMNKSFISPINNSYQFFYKYYLEDSLVVGGHDCFKIRFTPKWKEDFAFSGNIYIDRKTWAVVNYEMQANNEVNLNYLKDFYLKQEFAQDSDKWVLKKSESSAIIRFIKNGKNNEFTVHHLTSFQYIIIDDSNSVLDNYHELLNDSLKDPNAKTDFYWENARHDSLLPKEKFNYMVADTLRFVPVAKKVKQGLIMVASGYVETGPISLGQIQTFYSKNPIEDNRFKFGLKTNKYFNTKFQIGGYAAYGTRDKEIKYKVFFMYVPKKDNTRISFGGSYKYDITQMGFSKNHIPFDHFITSFTPINNYGRLTFNSEAQLYAEKFWTNTISNKIIFSNTEIRPLGELHFEKLIDPSAEVFQQFHDITITELQINTRIAFHENYYAGEFIRRSLGSKYPIFNLDLIFGFKNMLNADYSYQKVKLNIRGKLIINPLGYMNYNFEVGKIFGTVPYILLELHPGNQTLVFDNEAFNLMKYFEFASDQYISLHLDHHFDGFFLNKIPIIRKAKLREVVSACGVIGNMNEQNKNEMVLPSGMSEVSKPYIEYSAGIENIFKAFRIDYVWRGTHKSAVPGENWGIKAQFYFSF
jgi:hypothetical protein